MKLQRFAALSQQDVQQLAEISKHSIRTARARRDIIREGDSPHHVKLILDGWAMRYKMLPDGRRQIVAFLVPGDMCDLNVSLLEQMDHAIAAVTPVTYSEMPADLLEIMCDANRGLGHALWIDSLVTAAIQREWILSLGQRTARERVAHLFCELFHRLETVGLTDDNRCEMPLIQTDIGEATGMTAVHVNRTLQELRREGLIVLNNRILTLPDRAALADIAMFNPLYLHQEIPKEVAAAKSVVS